MQLIQLIKRNQQLARKIEPINVHTARALPPQLDGVPAILFNNQLLVGPDTFKWVQFQPKPEQRRQTDDDERPGMGPGMMMQGRNQQDDMSGIPLPSDISSDTKHGIDFTPLPGQENNEQDPTIPKFAFLAGSHSRTDGTVGIDYAAASDITAQTRGRSNGMAQQYEQLQKLRSMDNETIAGQNGGGGYNYARQAAQMPMQGGGGGMQGYGNGMQGGMQGGGMQGGGMSMQGGGGMQGYGGGMPMQGGMQGGGMQGGGMQGQGMQNYGGMQQNPYELQSGNYQGYGNMYQQQNNEYQGELPKRY